MDLLILFISACITIVVVHALLNMCTRRRNRLPPGPTPWPIVGNLPHLGKTPHHSLAALVTQYGPLIHLRLGFVDVVVAGSASVAAQCLKTHDVNFASRPPNSGAKHIGYNYQDMVFAPYGPRWRRLRKLCLVHLLSTKALNDFRHIRQEEVAILTRTLASAGESTVQLDKLLNLCISNALSRVMLGRRVFTNGGGAGGDPKADEFKEMATELQVLAGEFNIGDFIPALDWLDLQGITKKMKNLHDRLDAFLNVILQEHKTTAANGGASGHDVDFLCMLLSLRDEADGDEAKLSDVEIKALLLNLFVAGTDTSFNTVEWAIAELIRHPQILKQAQKEMDIIVGRDRLVNELDISQLTFLQAIVKETFRLHPATPLSLPRIATENCEVNGYNIPKGSTLLVHVWAIARDPKIWIDPLKFKPGRFLPGGEKFNVDVKGNDFDLIPFGAGRRICAGMSLGVRTVQLLTATLVQAFDWELTNGLDPKNLNMEEAYGLALRRVAPLMVHPRPRLAPNVYISG
ncbi:flavonoid 3'-monooxygenase [Lactuca sativa]|uniref:Flavonoid 3'-hydroxylase n=1 Tax=Lactuca sativa TaxID=4236 RepID=A0A9R1VBT9_LACSA|nr:flavonoid 3'-monooxygenase [Lactuca sativa]KAJ0203461.1 hypothetical protein LSAT_V11C500236990 [Lactuca sativa]